MNFPDYIMIQTVSTCNSDCIICPYKPVSKEVSQGRMENKVFKKIIDECSEYKNVKRILLYLMNEPLTDRQIVDKIDYAKERNPNALIHIVSNGNLLNTELSKAIINSKIDYIEFSILGGNKGVYERIMKGLKYEETVKRIDEFIQLSKKHGKHPGYINIKTIGIPGMVGKKELEMIKKEWETKGVIVSPIMGPLSRAGNVKFLPQVRKEKVGGCESIWRDDMIHIIFNGDIVLCCMDWRREVILGNITYSTIYEIWNSNGRKKIENMIKGKEKSPDTFICKRCESSIGVS